MTLKSADKIKVSLSDEGLIEMIEMKLEDSIEPLYRDRVSSLKHDRSLYELDRRVQNEARLIVKNIRTQMAEIKRGTGNQGQRGTRVSGRGRKTQQRPELDREFKLGLKSRNGNTMPPPIEYDYE